MSCSTSLISGGSSAPTQETKICQIVRAHDDQILHISTFLSVKEVVYTARTCKSLKVSLYRDCIWKIKFISVLHMTTNKNMKGYYKSIYASAHKSTKWLGYD